jgi:hypothetical protein
MTRTTMIAPELRAAFATNDGSLPDINFDFKGAPVVADAYALIQSRATALASKNPCYWEKREQVDCEIHFGDNPALRVLNGEANPFHVVFGGLKSAAGHEMPELGVFVLGPDFIALDYRMGPEWNDAAIAGLLELMVDLAKLGSHTEVAHEGNDFDPTGAILIDSLRRWGRQG